MDWSSSIHKLREFLLDLLWAQWTSLGLPGTVRPSNEWVADPEAFLIAGWDIGRYDSRLFDALASWMKLHGNLLDAKRLRVLLVDAPADLVAVAAALAEGMANDGKGLKWNTIASGEKLTDSKILFHKPDGSEEKGFGRKDPIFQRHGLLRHPMEFRSDIGSLPKSGWPGLRLRMRATVGIGIRAEIISVLLAATRMHPRRLAQLIGAAPRSVSEVMKEMKDAGILRARSEGRRVSYALGNPEAWASLAGVDSSVAPAWVDWPEVLFGLRSLSRLVEDESFRKAPDAVQRSRVLDVWVRVGLVFQTGILDGSALFGPSDLYGPDFDAFIEELRRRLPG